MICLVCKSSKKQLYYNFVNGFDSYLCKNCNHIYVDLNNGNRLDYSADYYDNYMSGMGYKKALMYF